jgi:hypothetical protein
MPANYNSGWNGQFEVSIDDTSITLAMGDTSQDGIPGQGIAGTTCLGVSGASGSCTGSQFIANWTQGKGCRMWNTLSKQIIGDYGSRGLALDAETGGGTLEDNPIMHDGGMMFSPLVGEISGNQTTGGYVGTETCVAGAPATCVITTTKKTGGAQNNKFAASQVATFSGLTAMPCLNNNNFTVTIGALQGQTNQFTISDPNGLCAAFYGVGTKTEPVGTGQTFPTALCSVGGQLSYCNEYYWEVSNRNVHPCLSANCQGHRSAGYLYDYRAKQYWAFAYTATGTPLCNGQRCPLFPISFPVDQHGGGYHNAGTTDLTPVSLYTTFVCSTD